MTPTARYFKCCDLRDRAQSEGASPERIARLKAWEQHLAQEAREAMRTPFTIADLFAAIKPALS
jgi:hypothetical protein